MLTEKTALIIGASGGIGRAIAKRLSAENVNVVGTYFKNEAVAREMSLSRCRMIQCDITVPAQIDALIDKAAEVSGKIDVVVLCAAPALKLRLFETLESADFKQDMDAIFWSSVYVLRKIVPMMKSRKSGHIVAVLSSVVEDTPSRMSSYTAAKSALLGLVLTLASEVKSYGIKVTGLSPSFVETELIRAFPAKLLELERQKQKSGQFLTPEALANLVCSAVSGGKDLPPYGVIQNTDDIERFLK